MDNKISFVEIEHYYHMVTGKQSVHRTRGKQVKIINSITQKMHTKITNKRRINKTHTRCKFKNSILIIQEGSIVQYQNKMLVKCGFMKIHY